MINIEKVVRKIEKEVKSTSALYPTGFRAFVVSSDWKRCGKVSAMLTSKELRYLTDNKLQNLVGWFLTAHLGKPCHFDCGTIGWTVICK